HAVRQAASLAILSGDREPLSYLRLAKLFHETGEQLLSLGIGPGDRVGIVLPNGAEMATCFLGVAGAATAAPLNPSYRQTEIEFYLSDLHAKALIVANDSPPVARAAARELGITVIELEASPTTAGLFTLRADERCVRRSEEVATSPDVALVLHTSGTTSRPKIVPLTQANLCTSARNISQSLRLTTADRCLNVMPLFHIHGLIGALLATLDAGGSVCCSSGFNPASFFADLDRFACSWFTAVPTIHQAVLASLSQRRESPPGRSLRFIRSCSASLPPAVMTRLEDAFGVPVVEAYGMTEAAHQMTCNPLPPQSRKPGSVGLPTGLKVAIMNEAGTLLSADAEGEVVIRGSNVTSGYESNPSANATAFTDGWFRTGDLGRLDGDGYLHLTGRIKEMINRGGEKISPREIDEVLLAHPDIAQALAFAVPHPTLGEDLAAAVVVNEGRQLSPEEIQQHCASRLAEFKVPRSIVFVPELPKGPTGKPQRIGLAEKLGLGSGAASKAAGTAEQRPHTDIERSLTEVWRQLLPAQEFCLDSNFFACGGNSLLATMLVSLVEQRFRVALPIRALFESGTLAGLAAAIDQAPQIDASSRRRFVSLVRFQTAGDRPPLFFVHGHSGRALGLGMIAPHLDADQPFYGFVARGMDGRRLPRRTIAAMAADYVRELREIQPEGPYYLGGFCAGGMIAYEMAQQLIEDRQSVALLALLDTAHPALYERTPRWLEAVRTVKLHARRTVLGALLACRHPGSIRLGERIVNETIRRRTEQYRPRAYPHSLTLIRSDQHHRSDATDLGWSGAVMQNVEICRVPGEHVSMLTPANIGPAARALNDCVRKAQAQQPQAHVKLSSAIAATTSFGRRQSFFSCR
ncbi:MAG: AMP-binding protein, partial [Planctomycetota bacterium]